MSDRIRIPLSQDNPKWADAWERGARQIDLSDPKIQIFLDDSGQELWRTTIEEHQND